MSSAGAAPALEARGVGRVFATGVTALDGVDLEVPAGGSVALVGPSGCGKTTLLRILGGLDQPTAGTVVRSADAEHTAFGFQEARLLPWRSVQRNIALPLELAGVPMAERMDRAAQMAKQVGLGDALQRLPGQLSGGMSMRAALARALVTRPRVLLLDEPFSALDEITRMTLDDLLLQLWQELRMTLVLVTHAITEAVYIGERVVVMAPNPGRVLRVLQPQLPARTPALRTQPAFAAAAAEVLQCMAQGMSSSAPPVAGSAP